jgi:type IV secretory pathway VirB10-like protein
MSSAYRLHPASHYSSPSRLHHKVGVALAFIAFGSIAGASGIMLQMAGPEPISSGSPALAAASRNPGTAHAASPAAPPPPAVSAPTAPPSAPAQAAPAAAMIAAAPEPAPLAAPAPAPPAAIASADAEAAATESHPPPPAAAAARKAKNKAARSQGRRDRGWYDAYAWSPRAYYGHGRHDYWRPIW